ncbi:MAG TPA: Clp protease N-terminal domain-containing protein [Edaphobacter sp.]
MFDRYTEKARRVIFFARYEASTFGSPSIETEHLLLGLLREDKALASRFSRSHVSWESIRRRIEEHTIIREKISTSVDLPLSNESKRVLAYAAEEAQRLGDNFIGTEHLLLGILREEQGKGAELLRVMGIPGLAEVRKSISESAVKDDVQTGRSSSLVNHSPPLRLIEDVSGKELLARLPFQTVPRIGEAVLLTGPGENVEGYRIMDVRWGVHLTTQGDQPVLSEVEIRVQRENFDKR